MNDADGTAGSGMLCLQEYIARERTVQQSSLVMSYVFKDVEPENKTFHCPEFLKPMRVKARIFLR